ncbi:glycosyltransferase family 2 protein [Desulfosudis oleivorans]|uniref:Ribonuclease III n=1 Tax=Desulfosudis oleivorans (strain DSM 6200 / JCM 39069 / Hxd3) TaxID=96561 RepID=A8ZY92_DESOH|nr:glycosyltransferase family 2 protein [Desulfosudis oleivorans]ABW67099.1 Ribonuclease III [Desulfosudis oleivorans Hxd3]
MGKRSDSAVKLSIVVPVYQSADILPKLVEEVLAAVEPLGLADRFELLLVNDASPDQSWPVIQSLARSHAFIRGISLRRNFGQHNALMAGLNHVNGDFVVMMDDDLQHPPDAIGDLLDALEQGYDVCYTRYRHRRHALWKQVGSRFNDWVATRLLDKPKNLYLSSFKAMRKEITREIVKYDGPYAYLDGLILDVTRSITVVEIAHQPRYAGESNYTLRRLLSLWLKMATGFSVFPLRLATYAGFLLSALSFIMMAFFVIQKLLYPEIPRGWASLIATILFLGGMQTFFLGLIGEYLGRTYLKLNQKAQFVVGSTTWDRNSDEVS